MPKQSKHLTRIKEDLKTSFIRRPRSPAIRFEHGQWQFVPSISPVMNVKAREFCISLNSATTPGHDGFCCCAQCLGLEFHQKEKNDQ